MVSSTQAVPSVLKFKFALDNRVINNEGVLSDSKTSHSKYQVQLV